MKYFRSVERTIRAGVTLNGCDADPKIEAVPDTADDGMRVTRKTWRVGHEGSEGFLIEIKGGGHTWPVMEPIAAILGDSTQDISANDLMWEFFLKHPKKAAGEVSESLNSEGKQ